MTVAVVIAGIVISVLAFLAIGLTYSYTGLLERVRSLESTTSSRTAPRPFSVEEGLEANPSAGMRRAASDLVGVSPDGGAVVVSVQRRGRHTLLAFLSSGCTSCLQLWGELARGAMLDLPDRVGIVVVTKGPGQESPTRVLELATGTTTVVMSSEAWASYEVPGAPYFVFVDGDEGVVVGEGTALGWRQVLNLMALSTGDGAIASGTAHDRAKPRHDLDREAEVDRMLMDAGVFPGDPSLYPHAADGGTDGVGTSVQ